MWKSMKLR